MGKKLHISFVLDETGSMRACKEQTIAGFNEYIETLRGEKNAADMRFTLTRFNSQKVDVTHEAVKLSKVALLTDESYQPTHLTPLYDAIGRTVRALEKKANKKSGVLVVIQTDGLENYSTEFTRDAIFSLIDEKKKKGWTFAFLGADQDAWLTGQALGLDKGNVMVYCSVQTTQAFRGMAAATVSYSNAGGIQMSTFWKQDDDDSPQHTS